VDFAIIPGPAASTGLDTASFNAKIARVAQ